MRKRARAPTQHEEESRLIRKRPPKTTVWVVGSPMGLPYENRAASEASPHPHEHIRLIRERPQKNTVWVVGSPMGLPYENRGHRAG